MDNIEKIKVDESVQRVADAISSYVELDEVLKPGTKVKVPHKGKMVKGKIVRYDKGSRAEGPFYVVDVGEYESPKIPAHKIDEEAELDEAKPEYQVKYAKSKSGPIKVTKFMTLDQAKEFLAKVKKDGMNGIISKGGKPVKEEAEINEGAMYSIKNTKTGQTYSISKYKDDKKLDKIRKAGGDHKYAAQYKDGKLIEEVELDEKTKWKMGDGRPRGGAYIENERFWDLPKASLEYIIKDAGEAIKANPKARKATTGRGNWADQINDAASVLGWRKKNGIKEEAELDEAKYEKHGEYDGKVVKISKKEFAKVSKDYKNTTKGKERMLVFDPKTKGTISVPVQFEEDELDEATKFPPDAYRMPVTAKKLAKYAVKQKKGPTPEDYDVFMWAAGMMKTGKMDQLSKYTMKQDTDVRDKIIDMVKDTLGKDKTEKIFPVKIREQEVDESVQRVANALSYHEARKLSPAARARQDALRDIGKDKSKDDDEVKATDADRERADRNILNKLKKSADVKGNYEIKFDKGPSKKVSYKLVQYALAKHAKMKPADKLKFQKEMEKSYKDFLKALKDM